MISNFSKQFKLLSFSTWNTYKLNNLKADAEFLKITDLAFYIILDILLVI